METLETPEKLFQLLKLEERLEEWKCSLPTWLHSYINHTAESATLAESHINLALNVSLRYHSCVVLIHRFYLISELARVVHLDGYSARSNRRTGSAVAVVHVSVRSNIESSAEIIRLSELYLNSRDFDSWLYATLYTFQAALGLLASGVLSHRSHTACWGKTPEESVAHCRYYTKQALEILKLFAVESPIASKCFSILRKAVTRVGQYWLDDKNVMNPEGDEKTIYSDTLQMLSSLASSSMYNGPPDLDIESTDGDLEGLLNFERENLFADLAVI